MQQRREGSGAASEGEWIGAFENPKIWQVISTLSSFSPSDDEALFDEVDILESGVLEMKQASSLLGSPSFKVRYVVLSKVRLLFVSQARPLNWQTTHAHTHQPFPTSRAQSRYFHGTRNVPSKAKLWESSFSYRVSLHLPLSITAHGSSRRGITSKSRPSQMQVPNLA